MACTLRMLSCLLGLAALFVGVPAAGVVFTPARSADDLANPHKGFLLWGSTFARDGGVDNFYAAHIYHLYLPWREIESADQVFDWAGVEARHLDPILAADPQATFVLRLVADYPDGGASGIDHYYQGGSRHRDYPLFLEQPPLSITGTDYSNCDGDGPGRAPDWNAPSFIDQARELVAALAARYDGDPRITAVQVGLLGLWGEWHQSGCPALAPGDAVKTPTWCILRTRRCRPAMRAAWTSVAPVSGFTRTTFLPSPPTVRGSRRRCRPATTAVTGISNTRFARPIRRPATTGGRARFPGRVRCRRSRMYG
jgi:hypothetical protein